MTYPQVLRSRQAMCWWDKLCAGGIGTTNSSSPIPGCASALQGLQWSGLHRMCTWDAPWAVACGYVPAIWPFCADAVLSGFA